MVENNPQVDNGRDIDVVMPMHNFIEYMDNYSKASGSLWLHCRDKLALTDAGAADNFPRNRLSVEFKQKSNWCKRC